MMKTGMKSILKVSGAMAAVALATAPGMMNAQSSELDALRKKALENEGLLKKGEALLKKGMEDERIKGVVDQVQKNPEAALDAVSPMVKEAAGRVPDGVPSSLLNRGSTSGVPATRSQIQTPAKPAATQVSAPTTAPSAPPVAAQTMIPEPVAKAERPPAVNPATQKPSTILPEETLVAANGAYVPPRPLEPRYREQALNDKKPAKAADGQDMEIISDSSQMNQDTGLMIFKGNVVVIHPAYNLKCDQLDIYMYGDDETPAKKADGSDAEFKKAIATGPMVVIERLNANGEKEVAKSRRADFNPVQEEIVLSGGPPSIQSGTNSVNPSGDQAKIVLNMATRKYRVEGNGGRTRTTFKIGGGKGAPKTGLPGGSLQSIQGDR